MLFVAYYDLFCYIITALIDVLEIVSSASMPDKPSVESPPSAKDGSAAFQTPEQRKKLKEEHEKSGFDSREQLAFLAKTAQKQAFLEKHQATDQVL